MMPTLMRMKEEFIRWIQEGRKCATTRLKPKECKVYELVSGSWYKPVKSGVIIKVFRRIEWSLNTIKEADKDIIYQAEGFRSWNQFWGVLKEINGSKLKNDTKLYTHWFEAIKV